MTTCTFPECAKRRVTRQWCSGHRNQLARGKSLRPLAPGHSPPPNEAYERQLREVAALGAMPLRAQAEALGVSVGRVKSLRFRARAHGYDVQDIPYQRFVGPMRRPPARVHGAPKADSPGRNVPTLRRCKCGLRLPCAGCPSIYAYAVMGARE
jgi:hypothetical protein